MLKRIARRLCTVILLAVLSPPLLAFAASPPVLEVYGGLPKTEEVALSPDGTMLAMVNTVGDQRIFSIQKIGGAIVTSGKVSDLKLAGLEWAGNDYVVLYLHTTSRVFNIRNEAEYVQGIIISVKDKSAKPLLRRSPDYLQAIFGRYGFAQQDGRWFGYYGVVPTERSADGQGQFFKQRYPDLYRVDLETGAPQRVTRGSAVSRSWIIDDAGQIAAESEYDANSGNWRVFLPSAPSQSLMSGNSPFEFSLAGWSRTPGAILVRQGGVDGDLVELHLDTGRTDIFLPAGKAMEFIRSPTTHLLLGAIPLNGDDTLMFDPVLDRHLRSLEKAFQGHPARIASVSADLNRIVLHVTGKDTSGTWQLVDFKDGHAVPIADDYPDVPDEMIGRAGMVNYSASDGLALQGVLTLPPGPAPHNLPLVVLPHGGPEARDFVHFDWWAQAFAVRGYAVFQPNFRGSGGYGQAFRNAGFGQWGRKMETDISDGVAMLAAKGIVDPHRACIVGASYGGYAALAGVTLQHGLYRCAASYGGVSDPRDLIYSQKAKDSGDTHHYADPAMRFWLSYLGFQTPNDDGLATISPKEQAKNADAPILLVYGEKDTVVPPTQSTDMASALKHAGKPVDMVELDGEDHWLSRSATRQQMLKAVVAFVEKYNPPDAAH